MKSRSIISATLAVGLMCLVSSSIARADFLGTYGGGGDCGCEMAADTCCDVPCCAPRVGLMDRLRARCHQKSCKVDCCEKGCDAPVQKCPVQKGCDAPVQKGCDAVQKGCDMGCAPRCGLLDRLRSRCCQKACVVDCCEPACGKVAPSCCDPCCAPRCGLKHRLRGLCHQKSCKVDCCEPACGKVEVGCCDPCGAPRCGLLDRLRSRCQQKGCVVDCCDAPVQKGCDPVQKAGPMQKATQK